MYALCALLRGSEREAMKARSLAVDRATRALSSAGAACLPSLREGTLRCVGRGKVVLSLRGVTVGGPALMYLTPR